MRRFGRVLSLAVLCGVIVVGLPRANSKDWPHMRGPGFDGAVSGTELFAGGEAGLSLAWRIPLGSGYSAIAVAGGRAVTTYSDGKQSLIVAVDASTGKEIWSKPLGPIYKAKDGADEGPLSTPVIDGGRVFALDAHGGLMALALADGKEIWSRMLTTDFDAQEPHYGFTTTPLVEDGVLVVQTGGPDGKSISGFDAATGETRWSLGDAGVEYQSPSVLTLAGKRQVVAVSGHQFNGIDASTGKVLWEHVLDDSDRMNSASPSPLGDDRFLVFISGAAAVFKVAKSGDDYELTEQYRSKELGGTYALPVLHEGHLYGFKSQFLSCVNAETGELVWKSRPPGGRGLLLVDGHLIVFAAKGKVVIVEATPAGYNEKASLQALEGSSYSWPSFADSKVFIRNLSEMAAVNVTGRASTLEAGARSTGVDKTEFAAWVATVEAAEDKQAAVDTFMSRHEQFPLIEEGYVHFVYQGEVDDIAVAGNMMDGSAADQMQRIEGTDVYYKSYAVDPGTRWEYQFNINFGERITDPRNPDTVPPRSGDVGFSEVKLPGAKEAGYLAEPGDGPRGTIETVTFKSEQLGDEREVRVYLPAGYADGDNTYPLLVVHELDWLEKGHMANALDNLIGKRVSPLVVAVVAPAQRWWTEAGGSGTEAYVNMLATELVPYLQKSFRLIDDAGARAVMGRGGFGLTAAWAALAYPDVFSMAAVQSVNLGLGSEDSLMAFLQTGGKTNEVDFYLDWNRFEDRAKDSGYDLRQDNLRLATALEKSGYGYTGGEMLDAAGWGSWPTRTDLILEAFFPME